MSGANQRSSAQTLEDGDNREQAVHFIQAAAQVNAKMYAEVERHVLMLDRAEQERDVWASHAKELAQKLVQARKHIARLERALAAATGQPTPSAGASPAEIAIENADEDARQVADLLQLQLATAPAAASSQPNTAAAQRAVASALYPASVLSATDETRTAMAAEAAAGGAAGLDPAGAAPAVPINPTPNQQRVLEALVRRGEAMGWLIQMSEVTLGPVLGAGEFGVTYLGTWRHSAVAIKVVRLRHAAELTSFLREVESMSYIRHPNVVPFLGACLAAPDRLSLVSEFMTGGTLADWLHPGGTPAPGTASGSLLHPVKPLLERLQMANQVAQGMCALESCRPPVLHRDLKPANVYLDARGVARVGDFGLSRRLLAECRSSLTGETGTYLYMAPEVMRHEVYGTRADVWSWGVMLSECITCAMPYGHTFMDPVQVAMAVAEEKLCPQVPTTIDTEVQLVVRLACQFDPELRPDFASLVDMLGGAMKHMEAKETARPTLLSSIQASLLGSWSGAWGSGTSYPKRPSGQQTTKQAQQPRLPGMAIQRQ